MYFQVCSNTAYPQHSGERYRTKWSSGLYIPKIYANEYEIYVGSVHTSSPMAFKLTVNLDQINLYILLA